MQQLADINMGGVGGGDVVRHDGVAAKQHNRQSDAHRELSTLAHLF